MPGIGQSRDQCFAVVDFTFIDQSHELAERKEHNFEALVFVEAGWAGCEVFGQEDLHPLGEEAGAGVVAG